jgi:hypothetical protein
MNRKSEISYFILWTGKGPVERRFLDLITSLTGDLDGLTHQRIVRIGLRPLLYYLVEDFVEGTIRQSSYCGCGD